jgi:hypothetical protein
MNEQIKELWLQAVSEIQNKGLDSNDLMGKFAELIVFECAKQVDFTDLGRGIPYGDLILKHFGMKDA